jgi:poly-beta-1,6-N-acetyl-D-glucosamine synthase
MSFRMVSGEAENRGVSPWSALARVARSAMIAGGTMARCVCVIPAHDEQESIAATLESAVAQSLPFDRIVVAADNCTDDTAVIAAEYATVITTRNNRDKKAGALNQALDQFMPDLDDDDCVVVMDADTTIPPDFLSGAVHTLAVSPRAGGVSSTFTAKPTRGLLGLMQTMEFFRYQRQIRRNGNRAYVLSGTASAIRVGALRAVRQARGGRLPYGGGGYYDTASLTEDNELTFALLVLGYQCVAPGMLSVTEVMPRLHRLYRQRHRWYLGALRNIREYGRRMPWFMRMTYWRQQFGLFLSLFVALVCLAVMITAISHGSYRFAWWTIPALVLLAVERVSSVWQLGWKARLTALALAPEQLYATFLTVTYACAFADFVRGRKGAWHTT